MTAPDGPTGTFHVLLVEDDPDDVFLARHAFAAAAPEATLSVARNTHEAHVALARKRPDLVLVDVNLPGPDGFEFLRAVRRDARYTGLPVIVLSNSAERRDVERAYELGANAYLAKPAEPEEMQEIVRGLRAFLSTRARPPPDASG